MSRGCHSGIAIACDGDLADRFEDWAHNNGLPATKHLCGTVRGDFKDALEIMNGYGCDSMMFIRSFDETGKPTVEVSVIFSENTKKSRERLIPVPARSEPIYRDGKLVVDELCICGRLQSEHSPLVSHNFVHLGHGDGPHCPKFRWKTFVLEDGSYSPSIDKG